MLKRVPATMGLFALFAAILPAQEAEYGVSMPVTATFGTMDTQRLQLSNPAASAWSPKTGPSAAASMRSFRTANRTGVVLPCVSATSATW